MSKKKKITLSILVLVLAYPTAVLIAFIPPFFKVTDPDDPRFEPEKFQLIDAYWIHNDFEKYNSTTRKTKLSIRKLFPHGTDIVEVDNEMLLKRGCKKYDESKYLKYNPYKDNPNFKAKKIIAYYCPHVWWGLFLYDLSEIEFPRLEVRIYLDKNDKVILPPRRAQEK